MFIDVILDLFLKILEFSEDRSPWERNSVRSGNIIPYHIPSLSLTASLIDIRLAFENTDFPVFILFSFRGHVSHLSL